MITEFVNTKLNTPEQAVTPTTGVNMNHAQDRQRGDKEHITPATL